MAIIENSNFHFKDRLSYRQAQYTVLIALALGAIFSCLQIYLDYKEQTANLDSTVTQVLSIIEQPASQAAYSLDKEYSTELISGLFEYKPIYEAKLVDDLGNILANIQGGLASGKLRPVTNWIFGKEHIYVIDLKVLPPPISFAEMGKVIKVGELIVKADTYPFGINFLERSLVVFATGIIRNLILSFILLIFFHNFLTKPFIKLEEYLLKASTTNPENARLSAPKGHTKDEFARMVGATNNLLKIIQQNVREKIQRIAERERMLGEIDERKKREKELEDIQAQLERTNLELSATVEDLGRTQARLIQSEKMVALGEVTASLSHEINTPLGLGVSGASHLNDELTKMRGMYKEKKVIESDFEEFLDVGIDITDLITTNLRKAYRLIKSFKQISVDQASEAKRLFKVKEYTEEILLSMGNIIKKSGHKIAIRCDESLEINGYPGALSQIINNLVFNSINHAFDDGKKGQITLEYSLTSDKTIVIIYSDNGKGMTPAQQNKIFEPFFTTKQGQGGSGLGMHIVYNIITKQFGGHIECKSELGVGTTFTITFSKELPTSGDEVMF